MNPLLEPEIPTPACPRGPRFWDDEEKQSTMVGLILTFILWWPLIMAFSWSVGHIHGNTEVKFNAAARRARQFNIQLAPRVPRQPPKPPPPNRFVETNPDAPQNIPDQTRNFAAQNQQAAQEKPDPNGHSDHAATHGRKDIESTQIVSGQLGQTNPVPPPPPAVAPSKAKPSAPHRALNPLSGFQKSLGGNKDAFGTNVAELADNMKNVPKKVEGDKDAPLIEGADANVPVINPQVPRPRLHLDQNVRPAIFSENSVGTSNIGTAGWDARWSNYGEYQQELIDTVQAEFDNLLESSNTYPPSGSQVTVVFALSAEGKIRFV
ncbi:MAG: hypothetical protein ABSE59_08590, partial [Opitutaceae bacterium]